MDPEKYWDNVAEEKEFPTPFYLSEFKKHVTNRMDILEVGCGYGRILNQLYEDGFLNLTGVDLSRQMLKRGRRLYPHLQLLKNDIDGLPFKSSKFDAVILIGVLTSNVTNEEQENLILEISRVLKNGGILYLSDFLLNDDVRNLERYEKYKDKYGTYGIFELPEGAVLRHHTKDHILKITKDYKELIFKKTIYTTMNGNKSNGFYYIGKRKP